MFRAAVLRRVAFKSTREVPLQRATLFKASNHKCLEKVQEPEVHVIDAKVGATTKQTVTVSPEVVTPPGIDVSKPARPLHPAVIPHLTPTLSKFTLRNKVAIVTGGGRGLGFNMAQALAEVGISAIALFDVQGKLGEAAAIELRDQTDVHCRSYKVDVRDHVAVQSAVDDVVAKFGRLDVLINAAGIADSNIKAEHYSMEMFRRLIDINLNGTMAIAQACGRHMIKLGNGGSIVAIASMSGSVVNYPQQQSCYNASKAGVVMLCKCLAAEWARYGIRVNTISPGYMDTALNRVPTLDAQKEVWVAQTPQKRLGAVDDLNNLAVYLASDASAFMTGHDCVIDGGYTVW